MEVLSFNLLSTWLIETQRPMLCACSTRSASSTRQRLRGCLPARADRRRLEKAWTSAREVRSGDRRVYLRTFNQIDETRWAALDEIIASDKRLALKPEVVATA